MPRARPATPSLDLARCATIEQLTAGVVMLTRTLTETVEMNGERLEVWLKRTRRDRGAPKQERHVGSGFLVHDERGAFLVTAAHVAKKMDGDAHLSIAGRDGRRRCIRLRDLHAGARSPRWAVAKPSDVAVLRLRAVPALLRGHFLPGALLDAARVAPARDLELVVAGFPLGLFVETKFVALTMRVHAASAVMALRGANMDRAADFFLLDHPATGGFSGGPVFVAPQVRVDEAGGAVVVTPRCTGILSQTIGDDTGAKFGLVTPSAVIRRAIAAA